jgi:hypothetical protein
MKTSEVTSVGQEGVNVVDAKVAKNLFIAHDFEAAATRCKAKVKAIAANCRSQNRRFRFVVQKQASRILLRSE